jgi:hypothetical protein
LGDTRKIRPTRSIIVQGLGHCDAGEILEVGSATAQHLIGMGLAEEHVPDGESPSDPPRNIRIETPQNRDPQPKRIAPAPSKKQLERGKKNKAVADDSGDGSDAGKQDAGGNGGAATT